jgi:hypothetical protein
VARGFCEPQHLTSVTIGATTSGYGTPVVMPVLRQWLDLWAYPTGDIEGSTGFALGLVGMTICDALNRPMPREHVQCADLARLVIGFLVFSGTIVGGIMGSKFMSWLWQAMMNAPPR